MKTNLKTIKEACFLYGCPKEVAKEILGFEKKLRERLKLLEFEQNTRTQGFSIPLQNHINHIKEILGE